LNGVDLRHMWELHARRGARVSMALVPLPPGGRYGGVELDAEERVIAFRRATPGDPGSTPRSIHHFIGVQVVDRDVFQHLPDNVPAESVREVYPALLGERPHVVWGYRGRPEFHDIGTPADYLRTSLALAAALPQPGTALRGVDSVVAASARVERTVLWDRVLVGAGSTLVDVIATDDVVVPERATFERCVIMRREDVPPGVAASIVGGLAVVRL
jgi:NDP-sugar pyrophosphorylase family protein